MKTRKRILSFLLILTLIMTAMQTQIFAFTTCCPQYIPTFEKYVGERFEVQFKVTSKWSGKFTGEIIFKNTGTETLENWALGMDYENKIDNLWTTKLLSNSSNHYVITNMDFNANIAPGKTLYIGFIGIPGKVTSIPTNYKISEMVIIEPNIPGRDRDKDGLPDDFEKQLGTSPTEKDTDKDGLDDGYEYFVLTTDPLKQDTDGNTVLDGNEDFDKDGLINSMEYMLGTDPFRADSDADGLKDKEEIDTYGTNPLVYDTDEDTISDGDEIKLGLKPLSKYTHEGILDSDYPIKQQMQATVFDIINADDNPYAFSLDITASGCVETSLLVSESAYRQSIGENQALLGKVIDLYYDENKVESATLNFKITDEYIQNTGSEYAEADPQLQGIKRYNIFKYFEEDNMLLPIETFHNLTNNTVYTEVDELGTYCVMDLEKWLYDLGITPVGNESKQQASNYAIINLIEQNDNTVVTNDETSVLPSIGTQETTPSAFYIDASGIENIKDQVPNDYTPITLEELTALIDEQSQIESMRYMLNNKVNTPVDITFVVDTTGSMGGAINNIKTYMGNLISTLYSEGITPYVSVVQYADYINEGNSGANIILKNDGKNWAYNKGEAIELISKLAIDNVGYDETPIDGLEMARRLNYRSGAIKFAFLITDEGYYVQNRYGVGTLKEMADLLKESKLITSVVTSTNLESKYKFLDKTTDGAWFNIYSNFSPQIRDFIVSRIQNQKKFSAVLSNGMRCITLEDPLAKGSTTDTDRDTLSDSDEVNWNLITIENDEIKLPTLELCVKQKKGYVVDGLNRISGKIRNEVMESPILPILSDPTNKDGDGDGYNDPIDPRPLKSDVIITQLKDSNQFVPIIDNNNNIYYGGDQEWYKFTVGRYGGCGPTAAANIAAYMARNKYNFEKMYNYDVNMINKEDYIKHMNEVYQYVTPIKVPLIPENADPIGGFGWTFGKPTVSLFANEFVKFAGSRNITIKPYWSGDRWNLDNVVKYVRGGLSKNNPIALVIGVNPTLENIVVNSPDNLPPQKINLHWVTITSLKQDLVKKETTIKVSTWGGSAEMNLKDVVEHERIYSGIIYFE